MVLLKNSARYINYDAMETTSCIFYSEEKHKNNLNPSLEALVRSLPTFSLSFNKTTLL